MAGVRVRIDDFEDGLLPDVCASSGAPGARLYWITVSSKTPAWLWLGVFGGPAGIVAALVLSSVLRKSASGYVPYTAETHARLQRARRRATWGVLQGLGAVVAAVALAALGPPSFHLVASAVGVAGLVAVVVFAFLYANPPGSVGGHLDSTSRWVELDPVSTRFAAAYEAQEAERRAARRDEVIGTRLDR